MINIFKKKPIQMKRVFIMDTSDYGKVLNTGFIYHYDKNDKVRRKQYVSFTSTGATVVDVFSEVGPLETIYHTKNIQN